MATLEERIEAIEKRNKKVEVDKAWEVSLARKVLITILTYLVIAAYLKFVVGIDPWINAIIPAAGFLLSTFTLSFCKSIWEKKYKR